MIMKFFWIFDVLRILTGENYKESERWTKLKMKDTTLEFALENLFIDWIWEIIQ